MKAQQEREHIARSIGRRELILYPDGAERSVAELLEEPGVDAHPDAKAMDAGLRQFILAAARDRPPGKRPPSVDAMRSLELVDYEPASDAGHVRFYPKGAIVYDLLLDWAEEIAVGRFGAMKIETPLLYDWAQPDIREQGESFHERHYVVRGGEDGDRELVLRFAGDFGLFRMMRDATLSYRNLPVRIYELSKSFRYERSGELSGLRRLRGFTMPDIHSFTADVPAGWAEYGELYRHYDDLARGAGVSYAVAFRVVDSFFREHRERLLELIRYTGRPAYIEVLDGMKHYWVVKHEIQAIDSVGGTCQLSTVQLDVVDSERYGIRYVDRNGESNGCVICHSSIGSIERWIYAVLEQAAQLPKPVLPLWLAPVQVRLLPVSDAYVPLCISLCRELNARGVRADVDDRPAALGKKLIQARREWINYNGVVGETEAEDGTLAVTRRSTGERLKETVEALALRVEQEVGAMPRRRLALPQRVSRRPVFRG
jgi:threonyl-tRNA synthetase